MFQGLSGANQDIPPFMLVVSRSEIAGINVVGLRRAGFSAQDRDEIKRAFKVLFRQGLSLPSALEHLRAGDFGPAVREIVAFCENPSKRGICTTYAGGAEGEE
jgi:UDP-N-acetylglucosamine acyltransferase